jgi:outer membrane protein OmpA-like peptidoglycan-associated protein
MNSNYATIYFTRNLKMKILNIFLLLLSAFVIKGQIYFDSLILQRAAITNEKEINTENLEFCPSFYGDFILFVKSNKESGKDEDMDDYFLDLAYAAKNSKGNLSKNAFFSPVINSSMHEGQAAYDEINDKIYFTRSLYNIEKGTRKDSIVLKIYESNKAANFSNPKLLPFCADSYNTCHPTLNRNGDQLIFSSNMAGSKGMDLYSVKKVGTSWSDPISLSNINTNFNEVFPFLYKDSLLIFSCNHSNSMGGYDFYYSTLSDTGWLAPKTFPYPLNSSFDEVGFVLNDKATQGYFASNRPGGKGKDDIYRFDSSVSVIKSPSKSLEAICNISVIDKLSFSTIKNANIIISDIDMSKTFENTELLKGQKEGELIMKINTNGKILYQQVSNNEGNVAQSLITDKSYLIRFSALGYEDQVLIYNPKNFGKDLTIVANPKQAETVIEQKKQDVFTIPTEVGSVVVFNNIYYEYGSAEIKNDAANELDLLYATMVANPAMRIQLSSHTDSRGNTMYNKQLSSQRAQSAKMFLVGKGIDQSRIVSIGFGESRIRNNCSDGVKCSEEDHLFNRRTEVLVIE